MAEVPETNNPGGDAAAADLSIVDRISAALAAEDANPPQSDEPPVARSTNEDTNSAAEAIEALDSAMESDAPADEGSDDTQASSEEAQPSEDVAEGLEASGESAEESEATEDAEVEYFESLADFAEKSQVEMEDLYQLPVGYTDPTTGQPAEFTLGEVKDKMKVLHGLETAQAEFEAEKSQWTESTTATRQQIDEHLAASEALLKTIGQQMLAEYNSINWNELRQDDPQEWTAKREEFREKSQLLQRAVAYGKQVANNSREVGQSLDQEAKDAARLREVEAMIEKRPSWSSEETRTAEGQKVANYLAAQGWSDAELEEATDHRLVLLALKAEAYDELQKGAATTKKRVRKIARRTQSPGRTRSQGEIRDEQVAAQRSAHRKTGSIDSAAQLISNLG